jgi:hypothetical protein
MSIDNLTKLNETLLSTSVQKNREHGRINAADSGQNEDIGGGELVGDGTPWQGAGPEDERADAQGR